MIITIIHLEDSDCQEDIYTKFILLSDGRLLFGKCLYHKDLSARFFIHEKERDTLSVIGAGKVPDDVHVSVDDEGWGNWESTGYEVVTPSDLREVIRLAFIANIKN